jgi:ligand-binding SRPBCC domain-containing protein
MPFIRLETLINAPIELCFDLSRDLDVHMASAGPTREQAIAGVTSGMVKLGDEITWEATHLGLRQRLTSKIIAYERPSMFIDEMLRGPFKRWRHKHLFETRDGETLMIDEVNYASPFGVIGRIVDMLYLENYMRSFLLRRNAYIKVVAESR